MSFQIKGIHPESDSEWIETETDTIEEAEAILDGLGEIDGGLGHWDIVELEREARLIYKWIRKNNLNVKWENDKTFWIEDVRYLYLRHKEDEEGNLKIFSPEFYFLIDPDELEEFMSNDKHKVDYYCFEFGGKIYYSGIKEKPELNVFKYSGKVRDIGSFDYLGIHGGFELCSGSRTYDAWCEKAKFLGITTLGLCEKHTLAGALKFQLACAKHKIKSIIGETINIKSEEGEYFVKIYVSNQIGWENLLTIHKILNIDNDGKFVLEADLIGNSEGLYCVFQHDTMLTEAIMTRYFAANYQGLYFQFDPVQYKAEKRDLHCLNCLKKALELKFSLVLICDSYYLDQEDHRVKQILQFIGNTGFNYQSDNQHFKTLDDVSVQAFEMFETKGDEFAFEVLQNAMKGLEEIVEGCKFNIELGTLRLPKYPLTEREIELHGDTEKLFWSLIEEGLERKIISKGIDSEVYLKRIETEFDVISRGGFIDYFLILNDIVSWCRDRDILTGLGRGSAPGSIISYLMDLTKIDPIKYDLLFERFLNEGRLKKGLPDIDTDLPGEYRDEIKRYVEERYGIHNVCSIGTYGTFRVKAAFKDVCRMKGLPPQSVNYVGAMLTDREDSFESLFHDGAQSSALKVFLDENVDAINDIELILNQPKNASIHAAGVLITPSENDMTIYDWMPTKKMDGILISEWEGPELESAGFLKEDLLGIRQLDKFMSIKKMIQDNGKVFPGFEDIDYNDKKVLDYFKKGYNQDLFHFGSAGLTSYSMEVKPDNIEELIAMIALYRPGAMEFNAHTNFVKIKFGKKKAEYDLLLEDMTKPTHGLYIYQEQIMKAFQIIADVSLSTADDIRKAIGKKNLEQLKSYQDRFIQGALSKGYDMVRATQLWNKLEAFAGYGFNRSHSAVYAMTGYFCQHLKYYFPMEFWTTSLQFADEDEIPQRIAEIRKLQSITILPPDINFSQRKFISDFKTKTIYWGLGKIKYAGEATIDTIIEERDKNGDFFSLEEFLKRIDKRKVNKRVVTNLILSGCFDQLHKVEVPYQRREILRQFLGKDMGEEYETRDLFFWFTKQREISQSGYFDYSSMIANSMISFAPQRYLLPQKILLSENIDKFVVATGLLVDVIEKKSKRGAFAQLIIDHNNELIEITLWSKEWEKYEKLLKANLNRGIIVSGKVTDDRYRKRNVIHSTEETVIEVF